MVEPCNPAIERKTTALSECTQDRVSPYEEQGAFHLVISTIIAIVAPFSTCVIWEITTSSVLSQIRNTFSGEGGEMLVAIGTTVTAASLMLTLPSVSSSSYYIIGKTTASSVSLKNWVSFLLKVSTGLEGGAIGSSAFVLGTVTYFYLQQFLLNQHYSVYLLLVI